MSNSVTIWLEFVGRLPCNKIGWPMTDSTMIKYGTHGEYRHRSDIEHFDDRNFEDQWQNEVYDQARAIFDAKNYSKILDYGCGSGFKLVKYFPSSATVGVEVEPALSYLKIKYPGRDWRAADMIGLTTTGCDMVVCSDVIEHLHDPENLLSAFAKSDCEFFVISTPALELLAERGISPRLGPPSNKSHVREWTTPEFYSFVSRYLKIVDHRITNLSQCTQMVSAIKI